LSVQNLHNFNSNKKRTLSAGGRVRFEDDETRPFVDQEDLKENIQAHDNNPTTTPAQHSNSKLAGLQDGSQHKNYGKVPKYL